MRPLVWGLMLGSAGISVGRRPDLECTHHMEQGAQLPFPTDRDNAARIRRKTRFLGSFETTDTVPVLYLNADDAENERLMMEFLLTGASEISGYGERLPAPDVWPSNFFRVKTIKVSSETEDDTLKTFLAQQCRSYEEIPSNPNNFNCWTKSIELLLTHLRALYFARQQRYSQVVIIEDNMMAVVPGVWEFTLDTIAQNVAALDPDWEIVRLAATMPEKFVDSFINGWKGNRHAPVVQVPLWMRDIGGASAYIVSRAGIRRILEAYGVPEPITSDAAELDATFSTSGVPEKEAPQIISYPLWDCNSFLRDLPASCVSKPLHRTLMPHDTVEEATRRNFLSRSLFGILDANSNMGSDNHDNMKTATAPHQYYRSVQMFSYNVAAADRSIKRVLSTAAGKFQYDEYVRAVQQAVEHYFTRVPVPGDVDRILDLYSFLWSVDYA